MALSGTRPGRPSGLFKAGAPSARTADSEIPESENLMEIGEASDNNNDADAIIEDTEEDSLSYEGFEAGLQDVDSQALCTQLAADRPRNIGGPRNVEESLASVVTIKKEVIDTDLRAHSDDPNKYFDIVTSTFVDKTTAHGPAADGFGSSLGKYLYEARDIIDPPVQIVFEGEIIP